MDVRIKTKDYEMSEPISRYVEEKMETLRKHLHAEGLTRCEVEIGRSAGHSKHGENYFAEMQLVRPGERIVRAAAHGETVQAAVDVVKDEVLGILRKEKTRVSSHIRRISAKVKEWTRLGRS